MKKHHAIKQFIDQNKPEIAQRLFTANLGILICFWIAVICLAAAAILTHFKILE